jgi:hypothetical protein
LNSDSDADADGDLDADGDGDSGSPCDGLSQTECEQANGCHVYMAWELDPYPIGPPPPNYCQTGEQIYAGCGVIEICDDAETYFCDDEGMPALFPATCAPSGWTACEPGVVADNCP